MVWLASCGLAILGIGRPAKANATDQLIVFVQPGASEVDRSFQRTYLPQIQAMAKQQDVTVTVVKARQGVPDPVAITPLVVFQNHRGRSIYQGRSNDLKRLSNFIRTARFVPQQAVAAVRHNIHIWQYGRAHVWAPIKITPLSGNRPEGHRDSVFQAHAIRAMGAGFKRFELRDKATLGRADRGFYLDLYPWLGKDGTLVLSGAVYSQFHCKAPVFRLANKAILGPWEDREHLFRRAAAQLEAAVVRAIADPVHGDGFDPVAPAVTTTDWQTLGLALPSPPKRQKTVRPFEVALARHWELAAPKATDPPMIQFRFPAPLDSYSGEVKTVRGKLTFPPDLTPAQAQGFLEVDVASVTMGEPSLDKQLQDKSMLAGRSFPQARFDVQHVSAEAEPIRFGHLSTGKISGTFTMKGKAIPLDLLMDLEPILGDDNQPRLVLRGAFEVDLTTFEIQGADGPVPQRHTLQFDLYLVFEGSALGMLEEVGQDENNDVN